jgi:hypothetical protein
MADAGAEDVLGRDVQIEVDDAACRDYQLGNAPRSSPIYLKCVFNLLL